MASLLDRSPDEVASALLASGQQRVLLRADAASGVLRSSAPELVCLADALGSPGGDWAGHEAVFLEVGAETRALFGAFIHRTRRGQAQGGLRHWPYPSLLAFLHDGLRLAQAMGRKCALAGLWWGGGKGVIARQQGERWRDAGYRRVLYAEYGRFVSSLRGCYVTAEDAGTTPLDMAEIHRHTRFATCLPPQVGGSGNPSAMTAAGVVSALEAALDHVAAGGLAGKRIAMQGGGNVGSCLIERLLERQVCEILVSETSAPQREALLDRFEGRRVEIQAATPGDDSLLAADCDVLVPCALGGVLSAKTIPGIRARIVCGAANDQLAEGERDAARLAARGIVHVPDYVANRMGIVACSNEQAGSLPDDPLITRHLGRDWSGSIYRVTREVLERAALQGESPFAAANRLADERAEESHPIFRDRARRIIDALAEEHWARGHSASPIE